MTTPEMIIVGMLFVSIVLAVWLLFKLSVFISLEKSERDRETELIKEFSKIQTTNQSEINKNMMEGFSIIQKTTDARLKDIQSGINEKLDNSLNERLDNSFKQVGERLESLYKSLGELKNLESGVSSLNRTLSNVKQRGVFGEMQLRNILESILDRSRFDENAAMKQGSDERVEFAVKIPDKDGSGGFIYLPIDSKFPADIYNRITESAEKGDPAALKEAVKNLKDRIKIEASTIKEKYVNPPKTTDFALMFLPTEGLYSEVLRIPGLVEECQLKQKVIITGPATLTAVLNSLSVGFKYLTVNKKSEEIMKTLGAFKTQFGKFDELIYQTQKKLEEAHKKTEDLSKRSGMIKSRLGKVESLDENETEALLSEEDYGGYFQQE